MFEKKEYKKICYFTSKLLSQAGCQHFFAARFGGVSEGDFGSLNVSCVRKDHNGRTDSASNVAENYKRALALLSILPEDAVAAKQIHSPDVRVVTANDAGCGTCLGREEIPACDGLVLFPATGRVRAVCVKTADCTPILLFHTKTGAVAALHAGWRGTVAGIAANGVKRLAGSAEDAENVIAAIGPCIGPCCYEVGPEVAQAAWSAYLLAGGKSAELASVLSGWKTDGVGQEEQKGPFRLSLTALNRMILQHAGVLPDHIDSADLCTCCTKAQDGSRIFFSHRGSGGYSGTFLSAVCPPEHP